MTSFVRLLAMLLSGIAGVARTAMVAVNVGNVGLRQIFGVQTVGAYEIVEMLLAAVGFLAIPEAFLRDSHITVERIDQVVPARAVDWLRVFGALLILMGLVLLLLMVTEKYRMQRLTMFWAPTNTNPTGPNQQAIQGKWALGDGGLFGVYAGTGETEVAELLPLVCEEIARTGSTVTEEELARAKAQGVAATLMARESSAARCEQLGQQILIYGRPLPIEEIIDAIEAVDRAAVSRVAARLLRSRPTFAALGPLSRVESYDRLRARLG